MHGAAGLKVLFQEGASRCSRRGLKDVLLAYTGVDEDFQGFLQQLGLHRELMSKGAVFHI